MTPLLQQEPVFCGLLALGLLAIALGLLDQLMHLNRRRP